MNLDECYENDQKAGIHPSSGERWRELKLLSLEKRRLQLGLFCSLSRYEGGLQERWRETSGN